MLSQSDELEQVTGIKEISKELRGRMKGFSGRLEEVRENIENTEHCYKMLDKVILKCEMPHQMGKKMIDQVM